MINYSIILDTYEGQLELNEAEFKRGGIAGIIIRLNDTRGSHHKDDLFDLQWAQSKEFSPVPYFVYRPWNTGQQNYDWLAANMPVCPAVFIDIELRNLEMTPAAQGAEFNQFIALCKRKWKTVIYTGQWFLPNQAPWPAGDYWWSAYPTVMYPAVVTPVTWDGLRARIAQIIWPVWNAQSCPGTIKLWQCSGDKFIVPGTIKVMDINVFPGTPAEYRAWLGLDIPIPPPVTLTWEQSITAWARTLGYIGVDPT